MATASSFCPLEAVESFLVAKVRIGERRCCGDIVTWPLRVQGRVWTRMTQTWNHHDVILAVWHYQPRSHLHSNQRQCCSHHLSSLSQSLWHCSPMVTVPVARHRDHKKAEAVQKHNERFTKDSFLSLLFCQFSCPIPDNRSCRQNRTGRERSRKLDSDATGQVI